MESESPATMHQPSLFLSEDRMFLLDDQNRKVSVRKKVRGMIYYQIIGVESGAFEKVCRETAPLRVCSTWNEGHECRIWEDVRVCTQWELISTGYSNIS